MSYNHACGGTIDFPKGSWEAWYNKWIRNDDEDYYYRYIYDLEINQFIGEIAYHKESKTDCFMCDVIILDKHRNKGYGKQSLLALCNAAKENGVQVLCDNIAIDNPSLSLFLSVDFRVIL
jgi:RimJ/RimL family protein N-acetyltransferase